MLLVLFKVGLSCVLSTTLLDDKAAFHLEIYMEERRYQKDRKF